MPSGEHARVTDRAFYVVGGKQRRGTPGDEWFLYEEARVLRVHPASADCEICLRYVSPPEVRPEHNYSCVFKCGTRAGDLLYLCTQTEVLSYTVPDFQQRNYLSLPCFNDLHHVMPTACGRLLIANTGLDMVLETDWDGTVHNRWNVLGGPPWGRFSPDVDYRKVPTTKPHSAHPNFVLQAAGDYWVTRFEQGDALNLSDGRCFPIGFYGPHDGLVQDGIAHFTTVDGHLVLADLPQGKTLAVYDLAQLAGAPHSIGWCRGVLRISEELVLVGVSRIRQTPFRDKLRWLKRKAGFEIPLPWLLPTRLMLLHLQRPGLVWELPLEEKGLDAVFSIHVAEDPGFARRKSPSELSADVLTRVYRPPAPARRVPAPD